MSNHPTNDSTYSSEASAADIALDWQLADIRRAQDNHDVTCREAADMRVAALEDHLSKIRNLRQKYWPETEDSNDE